jgi:hypothetical protein
LLRDVQQLQDAHTLPDMIGPYPSRLAGKKEFFKALMSEAAYQQL